MKNIEEYILEQEYSENYELIEEGFFSWLSKVGKKFWNWLTGKNFDDKDTNWKTDKKMKWIKGDNSSLKKFYDQESLQNNFSNSFNSYEKYKDIPIKSITSTNKTGVPIIQILFTVYKNNNIDDMIKILNRSYNISQAEINKIHRLKSAILVLSIDISENNDERNDDIWDDYIQKQLDNLCDEVDMMFFDGRAIPRDVKRWIENDNLYHANNSSKSTQLIMLNGNVTWNNIDDSKIKAEEKPKEETKPEEKPKEETKPEEKPNEDDKMTDAEKEELKKKGEQNTEEIKNTVDSKKNTFTVKDISFEYNINAEEIAKILNKKLNKDYKYILITDIEDTDSSLNMKDIKKCITSDDFNKTIKKLLKIEDDTEALVCFKIKLDKEHKPLLNSFDNMSADNDANDGDVKFEISDNDNGLYVLNVSESLNEALDIDNIFWMLDTWFANNEQEKTSFMSIIDNCIIKKTYNKNDLAKLCDNINFDIRPFINFMSKDAVVTDNKREDFNIDYYYELKKIIDVLVSNKSTSNKFVRFS